MKSSSKHQKSGGMISHQESQMMKSSLDMGAAGVHATTAIGNTSIHSLDQKQVQS